MTIPLDVDAIRARAAALLASGAPGARDVAEDVATLLAHVEREAAALEQLWARIADGEPVRRGVPEPPVSPAQVAEQRRRRAAG